MAASSAAGRTGLATNAFMPAARQRSRSPAVACAVTATIGVVASGPPVLGLRIAAAASKPSMPGIWTSMRMTS